MMTTQPDSHTHAARLAVRAVFFANGATLASWVSRIPAIKGGLKLTDGQFGLALFGMAVGALIAFPLAGMFIARFGSRRVTLVVGLAFCAALSMLPFAPSLIGLALLLAVFGACNGAMDVAMNAQGVDVERQSGRSLMSSFHAMWSLGGLGGAALGGLAAEHSISPIWHFATASLVLALTLALAAPHLMLPKPGDAEDAGPVFALPSRAVLGLGAIAFCAFLSEGAVADWSAVYLRESLRTGAAFAAGGYAAFSMTMTGMRFGGDTLITRLGSVRVVQAGGLIAGVGLGAALLLGGPVPTLLGFGCVGLGLAVLAPLVFSAAGHMSGASPGAAIAAVATLGYGGFLAGPPLLGLLAQAVTLRVALGVVALLCLTIALLGNAVRPQAGDLECPPD